MRAAYGGVHDTWESYTDQATFLRELKLELDFRVESKAAKGNATCGVACAEVFVEHVAGLNASAGERLVPLLPKASAHEWRYTPATAAPYLASGEWVLPSFAGDGAWPRAKGDFGRKHSKAALKIATDEHVAFFRTTFTVGRDPACYRALQLTATLVQGGRIWLNGALLWSHNVDAKTLPAAVPREFANQAPKSKNGDDPVVVVIPEPVLLLEGLNVLAVDVHELVGRATTSNDERRRQRCVC